MQMLLPLLALTGAAAECTTCGNSLYPRFGLEAGYTNFNHGSYGCVPNDVRDKRAVLLKQVEANPDRWFRTDYLPLQEAQKAAVAKYVNADAYDLVFVENASAGCNAFLRSFGHTLAPGSKVLYLSCAYGMVKQILSLLVEQQGVELVEANVTASDFGSDARVLEEISKTIEANGGSAAFSLGVISHISSVPAIILPLKGFVELLPGVPVFVDGAHAPGQIALDMTALRAAHVAAAPSAKLAGSVAYTGNMHKWMYASKGTAFLWASDEFQKIIIPPTLSNYGDFQQSFAYTGTRDYTAFCNAQAGIDFRLSLGSEADVLKYGHDQALWAGKHLSDKWGTSVMEPASMTGWMTNVELPTTDSAKAAEVATKLLGDYETQVVFFGFSNRQWTRLSAQVYLQHSDFERLGELVLTLLAEVDREVAGCGHAGCRSNRTYVAGGKHPHELTVRSSLKTDDTATVPTAAMLDWQLHDTGCFVHYNMATMDTSRPDLQGCQDGVTAPPPISEWKPTALDTDAWVSTCKAMGGTRMIYVAKHGCGFAAWKSEVDYNYSVTQAPDQTDVVAAFVKSARAGGIGVGFYYSDATNSYCHVSGGVVKPGPITPGRQLAVTQQQYDAIVLGHLAELWGNYGPLDELWFDGGYFPALKAPLKALITKLQPNATVLGGYGLAANSLRWVGTEDGLAPYPSWSRTDCTWNEPPKCKSLQHAGEGDADGAFWCPAETDFTLQQGDQWFYNSKAAVHTPAELRKMYEQSAGSNTGLIIDLAPFPNGSLPASQVAAAEALGKFKTGCYGATPVASGSGSGSSAIVIKPASGAVAAVDRVQIREDQSRGQIVRNFSLTAQLGNGSTVPLCPERGGSSIGNKYICVLPAPGLHVKSLSLTVTNAKGGTAKINTFAAFSCSGLAQEIDESWTYESDRSQ